MLRQGTRTIGHGVRPRRDLTFRRMTIDESLDVSLSQDAGR
jgi:hypothetical protein